ncbi:DNA polymerase III, subunits gamma and tau [Desulfamplus magnetovallimortis]|uniref:DNA polymerase III subunit gamma/tau n=1 Tax=Desulfamplus magnetovallimortis TaxID=1246637 RepID=A0A1W1H4K4_9BACT|nr:DNA polymerase III subunit gamma/tau [Desulfamplus magnetovallimortis]SLM27387.1 DNA polymerase III, subunits gamma and tau [Desulfamplus magnetovallimortis]
MSYRVLALKYRPQTFQDVIGQEHVTTTLSNAITSNRVAHAILLTGPRGTGKTTIARILAKAMNCAEGPTPSPCNICRSCSQITSGNAADVFEIDGASNNSVDQIRELRANVTYMPTSSPYKIYIIDEVHMLSTAAFNALLKTLEEPPEHVIFIFATTESHKIPITILSRCQRHDLGRLKLTQITDHLQKLCKEEGFTISRESLDLIASEADGSMRDSLSLLDRILSSTPDREISHASILNNLGIIDKKIIFELSTAILNHDVTAILNIVEQVNNLGIDLKKFYSSIIKHFRNLTVIRACTNQKNPSGITDISDHDIDTIQNIIARFSVVYLTQILNILLKEENLLKFASHTRTALEMILLKVVQIRQGVEIDKLIKKIDELALKIASGNCGDKQPLMPEVTAQTGTMEAVANFAPAMNQTNISPTQQPERVKSQREPENQGIDGHITSGPIFVPDMPEPEIPPLYNIPQSDDHKPTPTAVDDDKTSTTYVDYHNVDNIPVRSQSENIASTLHSENITSALHSENIASALHSENIASALHSENHAKDNLTREQKQKNWKGFIKAVSKKQKVMATILTKSSLKDITDTELIFELKGPAFELSRIKSKQKDLEEICSQYFNRKMKIEIIDHTEKNSLESNSRNSSQIKNEARNHPLVLHAMNIFSGNIVDIKTRTV